MARFLSQCIFAGLSLCLGIVAANSATHTVSVTAFAFTPRVLTVTNGDTVVWTGASGSHTVSPKSGVRLQ